MNEVVIITLAVLVFFLAIYFFMRKKQPEIAFMATIFVVVVSLIFFWKPLIRSTTGLISDYSSGELVGYVTEAKSRGLIWTTNEITLQIAGDNVANTKAFQLSVSDTDIFKKLRLSMGQQVIIRYRQWFFQPYRYGETDFDVISIEKYDNYQQRRDVTALKKNAENIIESTNRSISDMTKRLTDELAKHMNRKHDPDNHESDRVKRDPKLNIPLN